MHAVARNSNEGEINKHLKETIEDLKRAITALIKADDEKEERINKLEKDNQMFKQHLDLVVDNITSSKQEKSKHQSDKSELCTKQKVR